MTFVFAIITTAYLFAGIVYFSLRRKSYSQIKQTISELGEHGALDEKLVSFGLFLPTGIMLLVIALLAENSSVQGMAACLAAGYLISAFFPCDKGSPLDGSWRQHIHNLGGGIQYIGTIFFIQKAPDALLNIDKNIPTMLLIASAVLLSIPNTGFRGFVQRIAESLLFGLLIYVCYN